MTVTPQGELEKCSQSSDLTDDGILEMLNSTNVWYVIINGDHVWLAIVERRSDNPAK